MPNGHDFVFVHGGGQGGWMWDETIAALDRQTGGGFGRALALDVPGCGSKRHRPIDALTLDDVARESVAEIDRAGMADVVLVGHSLGGLPLVRMAALRPRLFRRLVYVSCAAPLPGQSVLAMMGNGRHGSDPDAVGWPDDPATSSMEAQAPLMFCNDMNTAETAGFLAKLGADMWPVATYSSCDHRYDHLAQVPATYVLCLRDMSLPCAWQEVFAARLEVARTVRLDAGHQAMNTRPQALAEILRHEADSGRSPPSGL